MVVLGLSGKYCAGKSTLAARLVQLGATEIDVDKLGHEVLESCRALVIQTFGTEILKADGSGIDRAALGRVVFGDRADLARLEAITHPAMAQRVVELIAQFKQNCGQNPASESVRFNSVIIVNAALLFKMKLDLLCDLVVWVSAPWITRLWRGLRRDMRGFWSTIRLMRNQNTLGPQHHGRNADIVRVHSLCGERFPARLSAILEQYHG